MCVISEIITYLGFIGETVADTMCTQCPRIFHHFFVNGQYLQIVRDRLLITIKV